MKGPSLVAVAALLTVECATVPPAPPTGDLSARGEAPGVRAGTFAVPDQIRARHPGADGLDASRGVALSAGRRHPGPGFDVFDVWSAGPAR